MKAYGVAFLRILWELCVLLGELGLGLLEFHSSPEGVIGGGGGDNENASLSVTCWPALVYLDKTDQSHSNAGSRSSRKEQSITSFHSFCSIDFCLHEG